MNKASEDEGKVERGLPTRETIVRQSEAALAHIAPLLFNLHPNVVGAVLLNLVATWLANHRPDLRDGALANWLAGIPAMVKACDKYRAEKRPDKLDS
jgi:hypothetical protein